MSEKQTIAVVGLGTIGHSLAQLFATGGCEVRCYDPDDGARASLQSRVAFNFEQLERSGLASSEQAAATRARLTVCNTLRDALGGDIFLVCEASVEDLAAKQRLFAEMESLVGDATLITSASSSFEISAIGARLDRPERALVLHPFNPPHLIPVVEVVPGPRTTEAAVDAAVALLRQVGKRPIRLRKECPGFIVNRVQLAMLREVWALLDAGVASAEDIDEAVKGTLGLRLAAVGPLRVCGKRGPKHAHTHL